ncbi:MAG: DUF4837 family protein [Gemmatimonadota bacterium]|nr:MAG: DUF4837 family protein [Gemmatimonadota bacterium]
MSERLRPPAAVTIEREEGAGTAKAPKRRSALKKPRESTYHKIEGLHMLGMMIYRRLFPAALPLLCLALLGLQGCKAPQAFGDRNSIIVRADPALWAEVGDEVMTALEQTSFTTRPERIFNVTYVAADDTLWLDLRLWHQVVLLGDREDEVIADLIGASDDPDVAPPAIVETSGKWARNQVIEVLLLPANGQADAVRRLLPDLYARLDAKYEEWIAERMYTTGVNDSLRDALADYGFTLDLPEVYDYVWEDSLFRFNNHHRQGDTDLLRSLLLTWTGGTAGATPEALRLWRERLDEKEYDPPQDILAEGARYDTVDVNGVPAVEFRGVWQDRSEFPAAGPFISRAIACPAQGRTYYLDAWVYAPGQDKYPYVRQVQILLDTFRCTSPSPV